MPHEARSERSCYVTRARHRKPLERVRCRLGKGGNGESEPAKGISDDPLAFAPQFSQGLWPVASTNPAFSAATASGKVSFSAFT